LPLEAFVDALKHMWAACDAADALMDTLHGAGSGDGGGGDVGSDGDDDDDDRSGGGDGSVGGDNDGSGAGGGCCGSPGVFCGAGAGTGTGAGRSPGWTPCRPLFEERVQHLIAEKVTEVLSRTRKPLKDKLEGLRSMKKFEVIRRLAHSCRSTVLLCRVREKLVAAKVRQCS
jgi:hypothetical protein